MHLSIEIPTPPPPRAKVGECGDFYGIGRHDSPVGVGDFSRFALHIHQSGERGGDLTRA